MSSWRKNHSFARGYNPTLQQGSLAPLERGGGYAHIRRGAKEGVAKNLLLEPQWVYMNPHWGGGGGFLLYVVPRAPPSTSPTQPFPRYGFLWHGMHDGLYKVHHQGVLATVVVKPIDDEPLDFPSLPDKVGEVDWYLHEQ